MMYVSHKIIDGCKSKFNLPDETPIFQSIKFIDSFLVKDNIRRLIGEFIYDYDDTLTRDIRLYLLKAMYHKDLIYPYDKKLEKEIMNIDYVNDRPHC